ncbi:hypothetical protein Tco_0938093 [Tanacetum coccineum]|uniref:Uncharacterized protein n=1 Tax=Tanacetum coccineum TaxID=301880 RepID=A0ABQ5DH47_9ASTR
MTRSSTESKTSLALAANLSELKLKNILIEKIEGNKSIHRSNEQKNLYKALVEAYESDKLILDTYSDIVSFKKRKDDKDKDEEPFAGSNRGPVQPWLSNLAREERTRESFDELMDTPLDFSAFMMNRLKIDTLTPELLAGPTFELMKGQQYPHDMRKPLPLIPNSRGRQVIPFDHFINNDLAYLSDLVPNTIWSEVPVNYDKHALWGISHCGCKRQQFYGFAANRESARDDYSKCRIIIVIKLQIVEWYGYKHLDWITVRKLININVKDCLAFGVSLRMFTRSIVIQRRVEDLQLGVESYHKKLNITKPDTYRSDLKRRDAYTAYYNPKGFIYQNKDKKNKVIGTKSSDDLCDRQTAQSRRIIKFRKNLLVGDRTRFDTSAGNLVKEILLKLNLPDHRILKDGGEVKEFQRSFRHSYIERLSRSDEVLKLKNFKKDTTLKLFKSTNQERSYSRQAKEQAQDLKSMITTSNHKLMIEVKDYEYKTEVEA